MAENKRYYAHKHLISEDKVHDKICHRFMNITETVEHMNMYYQKYTALKKENEQCKMMIATLLEENQSIKKHIGELYKYVKIDVDNEIEVYPKALLEGIVDILKIIGDVE